ncbi:hypothetical protein HAX54_019990, partial [Datura stramonium]|nr:hypothetical protein [Datura stramonium]
VKLFTPAIHQRFAGWHQLFTSSLQVGTVYSPVLRKVAPVESAIHRCFAGLKRIFTGASQARTGYSPELRRWNRLFTDASQ